MFSRLLGQLSLIQILSLIHLVTEEWKNLQGGVKKYTYDGLDVSERKKKEFWKSVNPDLRYSHFSTADFWR